MAFVGKDEIFDMRNEMISLEILESSLERSPVPDLCMKVWYLPVLELPETGYMKEATLVVVRPVDGVLRNGSDDYDVDDDDGGELFFEGEEHEKSI
ncbi:hypothetical protein JCGZ_24130 [Jatropha curcas]|uniref:Uncharacterized protein n=1 Tax=Jatropha curcas TaxID=180498 RepID=A0A067L5H6_JATCU|nr:hypothetical protein JCGZ_24130 [Jatropha curcas]